MARPTLTQIITSGVVSPDEPVRAIDVDGEVAAVFRLSTDERGAWYAGCTIARLGHDGSWSDAGSGGWHGRAAPDAVRPVGLSVLLSTAVSVDGGRVVRAVCGFVAAEICAVRCGDRSVSVSPSGAFVLLLPDAGEALDLHGLDVTGQPVGSPVRITL